MTALATHNPKSLALVDAIFGYTLGTALIGGDGIMAYGSILVLGSILSAALIILKPVDFVLKNLVYTWWRKKFEVNLPWPSMQSPNRRSFVFGTYSSSYLSRSRATIVGGTYLSFVIASFALGYVQSELLRAVLDSPARWILYATLPALIFKVALECRRIYNKIDLVASYLRVIDSRVVPPSEVQLCRKSLEEGNWTEANAWILNVKGRTTERQ